MENAAALSVPIIDASNCPPRMVFDNASKNLGAVIGHARRAFVREGKIAYIWRPPQTLSDIFREQAIARVYHPMATRLKDWFYTKRGDPYVSRTYDLTDALGFQDIAASGNFAMSHVEYRLEVIDTGFNSCRPYLRAVRDSVAKGQVSDANHVAMLNDGYGRHDQREERPIHFDGTAKTLDDYVLRYRRTIDIRAVSVDRGYGTRIYDLTADQVGGKGSCDAYGFKQNLVAGKPFLLSQEGDILLIETGRRPARQAFIHAASEGPNIYIYDMKPEELRLVRTYDVTVSLNRRDVTAQNKLWRTWQL